MNTDTPLNGDYVPEILLVKRSLIRGYEGQPREWFDPVKLAQLGESIALRGQLQPAPAKRLIPPVDGKEFELIGGERRWRASDLKNIEKFLIIIDSRVENPSDQYIAAVVDNFFHEMPTTVETAKSIRRMKEEFGMDELTIAILMGHSITWVYQHYRLLKMLHPDVMKLLSPPTPEGKRIAFTTAQKFVDLPHQQQLWVAQQASEQGLSMKKVEQLIKKIARATGLTQKLKLPRREFKKITGFVKRDREQLDGILAEKDDFILQALRGAKDGELEKLFEDIDENIINFTVLKETIQRASGGKKLK